MTTPVEVFYVENQTNWVLFLKKCHFFHCFVEKGTKSPLKGAELSSFPRFCVSRISLKHLLFFSFVFF